LEVTTNQEAPQRLERLIDANLNRLREGLRILEDIRRYLYNDRKAARRFKQLRHQLQEAYDLQRLRHRDIRNDVLKESTPSEMGRSTLQDLLVANFSRSQESARVLEEAFKLTDARLSSLFKSIRYELYDLEKLLLDFAEVSSSSNSK
jgi:thiamine-phosphate pyrophosphorylase